MEVRLPQLAEGADSGSVVNLLVAVGDKIRKDQTLLELENQKAVAPISAPADGTIAQIHVKPGDVVSVGQLLVSIDEEGAAPSEGPVSREAAPVRDEPVERRTLSALSGLPPPASPSIRKMAKELGVDLSRVPGSGHGGRITPEDVRAYVHRLQAGAVTGTPRAAQPQVDFSKWGPVSRGPFTPLRQAIARAMQDSWATIPHVTLFDEADIRGILALIQKQTAVYEKNGLKLTLTGFVVRALAQVLKKHPVFNSSLDESSKEIVYKEYIHIGIAVDTPAGLMVPVFKDADKKSMAEIARGLQEMAEKARARKVAPEELQGGSFTVSNQGGIGGGHFTPIIRKPEVAILGLGRAKAGLLPLALSFDHRVADGADAARFMRDLVPALETFPESEVTG